MGETEFRDPEHPRLIEAEGHERNRPRRADRGDTRVGFQIQVSPFPAAELRTNLLKPARGFDRSAAPQIHVGGGDVCQIALSLRGFGLLLGFATRRFGSEKEHRTDNQTGDEHQEQPGAGRHRALVLPHEPAGAIADAWRPRDDHVVLEMTHDVGCELGRRRVSTRPVLLERFHRDPIQVAAQKAIQRSHVRVAASRDLRRRRPESLQLDGRPRGFVLANDAPDLLVACFPQHLRIEGQGADEQLVEHDAQRVDIGRRINVHAGHVRLLRTHVGGCADHDPELGVLEAESWYAPAAVEATTPERLFERRWALSVLEHVMARLRTEYSAVGKTQQFARLEALLTNDARCEPLAQEMGVSSGALRMSLHRLRRKYRHILREEIAETVSTPAEIDEEIRFLMSVL